MDLLQYLLYIYPCVFTSQVLAPVLVLVTVETHRYLYLKAFEAYKAIVK